MCEHAPTAQTVLVCTTVPTKPGDLAVVVATAAEFGGLVSRFRDGGIAATFGAPIFAVGAAFEMQRVARNTGLRGLAIGVDHGDVERVRGIGPIGMPPYIAGQLATCSRVGDIALTERVTERLAAPLPAATMTTLTTTLPGIDGRHRVHVVTPQSVVRCRDELVQAIASPMAKSTP